VTRYEWVLARKAENFPVTAACGVAEVSTQAFNDWRRRRESDPTPGELEQAALVEAMWEIHTEFDGVYGSPRMTVELNNQGWVVNHKRVERLMVLHGIVGVHKPAKVRTTVPAEDAPPLPDLIGRRFKPGRSDAAWVGDITYIPTGAGRLYLATVIDLGSRRLLGYAMANHMRTQLVVDALEMAAATRGGATRGVIFHSDRGSQYMSGDYAKAIWGFGMRQSVGRTGVCWDCDDCECRRACRSGRLSADTDLRSLTRVMTDHGVHALTCRPLGSVSWCLAGRTGSDLIGA